MTHSDFKHILLSSRKCKQVAVGIFLFLLAACRPAPYPQALRVADSLATACPDSAVALLRSLRTEMAEERQAVQMYYRLLCVKAQDKAYIPHTSDSTVQSVLHYYEKRKDCRHLPEAYYYAGRVAGDLGDAPQALDYFGKALEAMAGEELLPLRSKVLSQMGTLFYRQEMYPEALEKYRQSLACDSVLGDSVGMAFNLRDIGYTYIGLGKKDSTLFYLLQAHRIGEALHKRPMLYPIQNVLAELYAGKGKFDLAHQFLQKSLRNASGRGRADVYATAGTLHQMQENWDSACWYYRQAIQSGSIPVKRMVYGNLAQILLDRDNPKEAIQCLRLYNAYSDSVQHLSNTEGIRQLYALYNYQLREKENTRLRESNARKTQRMVCLALGMGVLLIGGLAFYWKRKREWKTRLEAAERSREEAYRRSDRFIGDNRMKMERLQDEIRQLQHNLESAASIRKGLEEQITQLEYANQQALLEQEKRKLVKKRFVRSDIYGHFKKLLKEENPRLTARNWKDLQAQLDECYDGFTYRLEGYHKMSDREMQISMLRKAGFSCSEIGKLAHLSQEGVSSVRRRLYAKVFHKEGSPQDWDDFIASL